MYHSNARRIACAIAIAVSTSSAAFATATTQPTLSEQRAKADQVNKVADVCRLDRSKCGAPAPARTDAEADAILSKRFGLSVLFPISEDQAIRVARKSSGLRSQTNAVVTVVTMSLHAYAGLAPDASVDELLPGARQVIVTTVLGNGQDTLRIPHMPGSLRRIAEAQSSHPDFVTIVFDKRTGVALSRCFAMIGSDQCYQVPAK